MLYRITRYIYSHPPAYIRDHSTFDVYTRGKVFDERLSSFDESNTISIDGNASELHKAAQNGDVYLINYLVNTQHIHVNIQDCHKQTPLHYAAYYRQFTALQTLLQLSSDPKIEDSRGRIARNLLPILERDRFDALTR